MNQEKVGKFIVELRKEKGLTQEDIARHLGLTSQAVSKWERGLNAPNISVIEELAKFLEVDVTEILRGEKNTSPKNVLNTSKNNY